MARWSTGPEIWVTVFGNGFYRPAREAPRVSARSQGRLTVGWCEPPSGRLVLFIRSREGGEAAKVNLGNRKAARRVESVHDRARKHGRAVRYCKPRVRGQRVATGEAECQIAGRLNVLWLGGLNVK